LAEQELQVLYDACACFSFYWLHKRIGSLPLTYLANIIPTLAIELLLMNGAQRVSTPTLWYALSWECIGSAGWYALGVAHLLKLQGVAAHSLVATKFYFACSAPIILDVLVRSAMRMLASQETLRSYLRGEWRRKQLGSGAKRLSRALVCIQNVEGMLIFGLPFTIALSFLYAWRPQQVRQALREGAAPALARLFAEPQLNEHNGALRNLNARLSWFNWMPGEECSPHWAWIGALAGVVGVYTIKKW
jgi:hypothetical protein